MYVGSIGLELKGYVRTRGQECDRCGLDREGNKVLIAAATGETEQQAGGGDEDGDVEPLPVHETPWDFLPKIIHTQRGKR